MLRENGEVEFNYLDCVFRHTSRHTTYAGIENADGSKGYSWSPLNTFVADQYVRVQNKTVVFTVSEEQEELVPDLEPEPDSPPSDIEPDIKVAKAFLEQAILLINQAMEKLN